MPQCVLVFPPHWLLISPYLSMGSLPAFLAARDSSVKCVDANVICSDWLLTRKYLDRCRDRLEDAEKKILRQGAWGKAASARYMELVKGLVRGEGIPEEVERAKRSVRSGSGVRDLERYRKAWQTLDDAFYLVSQAHYPLDLRPRQFQPKQDSCRISGVIDGVDDADQNVFIEPLRRVVLPEIVSARPSVVGISIVSRHQVIPGMTVARLVKARAPSVLVVVGGPFFSMISARLHKVLPKFPFVDAFVCHDGEKPLLELVGRAVRNESWADLDDVPNTVYRTRDGLGRMSGATWVADLNDFPTPDFSGLPMDLYLSPSPILPYEASRGCLWRKCAFCDAHRSVSGGYRERSADLVIEDLGRLIETNSARYVSFVDMSAPPRLLAEISQGIIDAGLTVRWSVQTRMTPNVSKELISKMYRAGCRQLFFGLESASPRVLGLIDKGIDTRTVTRVIRDVTDAGIMSSLFVMYGFPTETDEDRERTIRFLERNRDRVDSIEQSFFGLFDGSRISACPSDYSLSMVKRAIPLADSIDEELLYEGKDCYPADQYPSLIFRIEDRLSRAGVPIKYLEPIDADLSMLQLADVHGRKRLRAFLDSRPPRLSIGPSSRFSLDGGVRVREIAVGPDGKRAKDGLSMLAYVPRTGKMVVMADKEADVVSLLLRPKNAAQLAAALSTKWDLAVPAARKAVARAAANIGKAGVLRAGR